MSLTQSNVSIIMKHFEHTTPGLNTRKQMKQRIKRNETKNSDI